MRLAVGCARLLRVGVVCALAGTFVPVSALSGPFEDGLAAYDRGDYEAAITSWRLAAELGDAEAQFRLGAMYADGDGVSTNPVEAVGWWQLAADNGLDKAQFNLGSMYAEGLGVPQDYAEAAEWWRLAAEQGYARAQYNLGVLYARGDGVPKDFNEAARWHRLAAQPR